MSQQRFTLRPFEKLKSRKLIDQVFKNGRSFSHFPFRVIYLFPEDNNSFLQTAFSVGTKNFKRAVDRNRIKRLMREAYRLQKNLLQKELKEKKQNLIVFIIYTGNELPLFEAIRDGMDSLLQRLQGKIVSQNPDL